MSEAREIRDTILDWLPRCGALTESAHAIAHRFRFGKEATEIVLDELADEGLIKRHVSVSYGPASQGGDGR